MRKVSIFTLVEYGYDNFIQEFKINRGSSNRCMDIGYNGVNEIIIMCTPSII